jgi:Family of unknown function (DUF5946)
VAATRVLVMTASHPGDPATSCPGCAVALPVLDAPTHPYIGASPACWGTFGELSAREYQDRAYAGTHQISVDVYAVQHPGRPERRAVQSVAVHLMTLAMILEDGTDPLVGPRLHKRMVRSEFAWLDPPAMQGRMNVSDVLPARTREEHRRLVRAWAQDVWMAWEPHHATVRRWVEQSLKAKR